MNEETGKAAEQGGATMDLVPALREVRAMVHEAMADAEAMAQSATSRGHSLVVRLDAIRNRLRDLSLQGEAIPALPHNPIPDELLAAHAQFVPTAQRPMEAGDMLNPLPDVAGPGNPGLPHQRRTDTAEENPEGPHDHPDRAADAGTRASADGGPQAAAARLVLVAALGARVDGEVSKSAGVPRGTFARHGGREVPARSGRTAAASGSPGTTSSPTRATRPRTTCSATTWSTSRTCCRTWRRAARTA